MTPAYLGFFGFKDAPFSKEIGDADLWLPSSKAALVDELCEALNDRASVVLVGEPGVGKTCVLRSLRQRLPASGFRLTYCHNATLGRRDFYRQLCLALGLTPSATAAAVFYAVTTHVEELGHERLHPVFLLDESHLLHQEVLDHLHILLNYQWDSRALLSLVLVGLPELEARLAPRHHRSLFSRIHTRLRIDPLTPDDTAEYLRIRLGSGRLREGTLRLRCHRHAARGGIRRTARSRSPRHSCPPRSRTQETQAGRARCRLQSHRCPSGGQMTPTPPTRIELAEAPELAVLHALEIALLLVERTLLATHPELDQADFFPAAPPLTADAWIADAILTHVTGLELTLGRYKAQLRRRPVAPVREEV